MSHTDMVLVEALPSDMRASDALIIANRARDRRDWPEAVLHYRIYLRSKPGRFAIWVQLGHALKESGARAEAVIAYSEAQRLKPRDPDLLLNLGHLHKLMGHREDALDFYRRSAEIDGNAAAVAEVAALGGHLSLATPPEKPHLSVKQLAGSPGLGLRAIDRLINAKSGKILTLADQARDRREWSAAAEQYRRYLKVRPDRFEIWVQLGNALKECGDLDGAREAYDKALHLSPLTADTHLQLGHLFKIRNEIALAEGHYVRAFLCDPSAPHAINELQYLGWKAESLLHLLKTNRVSSFDWSANSEFSFQLDNKDSLLVSSERIDQISERPWLPSRFSDFWIDQSLRDYLFERFGQTTVEMIEYLMAIIGTGTDDSEFIINNADGIAFMDALRKLACRKPSLKRPDVSIIIPVYNNLIYTLTCLYSLYSSDESPSFEILVGDDKSTDLTYEAIDSLGGEIRIIRHDNNLGFLDNCNSTAAYARGKFVVFLNNDTLILPNWLSSLIDTFDLHEGVGYVGSKLLNANGTLQEAGGIFWSDASAWNYGRDSDPRLPEYNYFKDVDYCSGASIALPIELWRQLNGFDRHFLPAYCEDADLAFRVRNLGYRAVYQPHSELIHHEGKSHGKDINQGVKSYQVTNLEKLRDRWRNVLAEEHFPNAVNVFLARDRTRNKPHILIVDHYVPQWDRDAGSKAMYSYILFFLRQGFHVTFWPDNLYEDLEYTRPLQRLGVEIIYSSIYSGRIGDWIRERADFIDYVMLSRPNVSIVYIDAIRAVFAGPILYMGHDLHYKRLTDERELDNASVNLSDIVEVEAQEREIFKKVDHILYFSHEECQTVRNEFPKASVIKIPLYIYSPEDLKIAAFQAINSTGRNMANGNLLFVGGFNHRPNLDAIKWFISDIFHLILKDYPDLRVLVAGSNMPKSVVELAGEGIEILGRVSEDTLDLLHKSCAATIVPLRYGAGVKGKVISAFANGLPVISTDIGLQGIDTPGDVAFVANDAASFAKAVADALRDRNLAKEKALNAINLLSSQFTDDAVIRSLSTCMSIPPK